MSSILFKEKEILESCNKILDTSSKIMSTSSVSRPGVQSLFEIKFKGCEKQIFDLLLFYISKSEAMSPGSSEIFLSILEKKMKNQRDSYSNHAKRFHKNDLENLLSTFSDEITSKIIIDSLELSGFGGKILLSADFSKREFDVVELMRGFLIENTKLGFFMKPTKFLNARVFCLDGYIENVSEIHHLLESVASIKEPVIAFLRGLSDDVAHTLKVNFERGTLAFIPIIVDFDLNGINLLNDIAIICNSDIISSNKGNLISSIKIDDCRRVDSVLISKESVGIENCSTNVDSHIASLQRKILESENSATSEILEKRIQRLGSDQVVIKMKDDRNRTSRSFMIDRCLRAIKLSIDHGVSEFNGKLFPLSSIKSADFYSEKFLDSILSLGAIISL